MSARRGRTRTFIPLSKNRSLSSVSTSCVSSHRIQRASQSTKSYILYLVVNMATEILSFAANTASVFGLYQAADYFKKGAANDVAYAEREYKQTKKFESTEMERDIWQQLSAKINNQILAVTLFFASSFGLAVEGILPSQASSASVVVVLYSTSLALSQVLLIISFSFSYKLQNLVNTFRIQHENKESLRERTRVETFYTKECAKFENCSSGFLVLGVFFLLFASVILTSMRLYYEHSNGASVYAHGGVFTIGFFVVFYILFCINDDAEKTKTGVENQANRKRIREEEERKDQAFRKHAAEAMEEGGVRLPVFAGGEKMVQRVSSFNSSDSEEED